MKITKRELKQMINEAVTREMIKNPNLNESQSTQFKFLVEVELGIDDDYSYEEALEDVKEALERQIKAEDFYHSVGCGWQSKTAIYDTKVRYIN